jgi:Domain of unknown function (DUF4386)
VSSIKNKARFAGLLYASTVIFGPFYLLYLPDKFIVSGNASATAARIAASESLFRLGIVAEIAGATVFMFVVLALYDLLKEVDRKYAAIMVILFGISVPISCVNALNQVAILKLLSGGDFLSVFNKEQVDALVMMFVRLHGSGNLIAEIFWGLWLAPFGVLVFRSGFLPRILGVLLMISCIAYVAVSVTALLSPAYSQMISGFMMPIAGLGELAIMLWLVIMGAKDQPLDAPG